MTWIETDSLSFTARHDDADLACAHRVLDSLEDLRLRLEDRFDQVPGDVTVILHDNPAWLSMAHPLLPAVRWSAAPAARRYLAGWPMAGEIHTLNDSWMERRSAGEDSLRALRGTAERMYAQIVLAANNPALPPMWTPRRFVTYLRWAWLIEGAAQYFAGQTSFYRAAVITRLREGDRPAFPPSRRDALILGGTVFDLLDRHAGPDACVRMASRLHRQGPRGNLELAFEARMRDIERAWRSHLDEILYRQSDSLEATSLERRPASDPISTSSSARRPSSASTRRRRGAHDETRDRGGRRSGRRLQRPRSGPTASRAGDPIPGSESGGASAESMSAPARAPRAPPRSPTREPARRAGPPPGSRGRRSRAPGAASTGCPWSSRIDWIISPSAMLRAPVTRTRSPCAYCGRTLRARSCASVIGSSSRVPA